MSLPDMALSKAERKRLKKERRQIQQVSADRQSTVKKIVITLLGITAIILLGWFIFSKLTPLPESERNKPINQVLATDWFKGNPDSPVVIVEYSDFQCPSCKLYKPIIHELVSAYADNIVIVYRHFPLKTIHLQANLAAQAAEAAGRQGKFWEMHDLLFDKQSEWAEKRQAKKLFISYAESLNLDLDRFQTDLTSSVVKIGVEGDYVSGISLRLNSTPSFFLNGERIQPPQSLKDFQALIDPLLPATGSATPSAQSN